MSNHYDVQFKYLTIVFINYTSVKLEEKASFSECIEGYSITQEKKKEFLDFEYKRRYIVYLSISALTFFTVALTHLQCLLTYDM